MLMPKLKWGLIIPGAAAVLIAAAGSPEAELPQVTVYKSPTCGCCTLWVEHMRSNGFEVSVVGLEQLLERKAELGVPEDLYSCHTAVIDGYLVEGHVPADVILTLLDQRPNAVGLAVPGMPLGSPGMEGPTSERYEVIMWHPEGQRHVVARRPIEAQP